MHTVHRNVNHAFNHYVCEAHHYPKFLNIRELPSRNGPVMQIMEPVTITYESPRERVLFNPARDANPFFHLYEALWMLAGRRDVAPVAYYASNMRNYSDDGETLNGAYGYRWRQAQKWVSEDPTMLDTHEFPMWEPYRVDQLETLLGHLAGAEEPTRRAVLSMWNVEDDLLKVDSSKDVCCNLAARFKVREERTVGDDGYDEARLYLDMTVFNRSNDLVWGAFGANVVHFSFLQEYMACALGIEVGRYNQISDDLHIYVERWNPDQLIKGMEASPVTYPPTAPKLFVDSANREDFDQVLVEFVSRYSGGERPEKAWTVSGYSFLDDVAVPMCESFYAHKRKDYDQARSWLDKMPTCDWELAARLWIQRRDDRFHRRTSV